jgi:hypothetical protein
MKIRWGLERAATGFFKAVRGPESLAFCLMN